MKTIIVIALLVAVSMAVTSNRPMTNAQIQKFESLKKDNKWASIMMKLAELHVQAQAPLDELVDAIEEVIQDNDRKTDRAHEQYERDTNKHEAEVARIQGQIDTANEDIAHTTEFLNNVLYVQRDNLETDIANLKESIENTHKYIAEQTTLRAAAHEQFLQVIDEHNEALEAVHEALEVLSQLYEGASLLQVKRAKKSLEKVQAKISKNVEGSMVKALLALTNSEVFANQESLQKVHNLLNEVASNLVASIAKFTEDEENAIQAFNADMSAKNAEINNMSIEVTDKTEALEQTNASIVDNEEFLEQRKRDLAGYEQDLVDENEAFDRITARFEDLIAQLSIERKACLEALDVLNSSDIAGYIGNRMEMDVVIDQQHGTGITVERNSGQFDFQ